jgi:hypothetical protein
MYSKENLDILESQLIFIKDNIVNLNTNKPIHLDRATKLLFYKRGLTDSIHLYNPQTFGSKFVLDGMTLNCNDLEIDDIVIGYYSLLYIHTFSDDLPLIGEIYKYQNGKLFTLLKSHMSILSFGHSKILSNVKYIIDKIKSLFKKYGFLLPSIKTFKSELIELYKEIRLEKRQHLPDIYELLVNNTLYIVNNVHGGIINMHKPDIIDIPDTMDFYRIMTSDYGSCSIGNIFHRMEYIEEIQKFINIPYKNTDKNNKKRIKTIISVLIKKIKPQMNFTKSQVNHRTNITTKFKNLYKKSYHHAHDFSSNKIIDKTLQVNLNVNDGANSVSVVHPMEINLMDYIDVIEDKGILFFNLKQIIDLIKDVKYVLFLDMSCSWSAERISNNDILNNFKAKAQEIEGPSITNNITNYVNTSPYNISPLGAGFNLVTGSNLNRTKKSNN